MHMWMQSHIESGIVLTVSARLRALYLHPSAAAGLLFVYSY
jgi:hypothetical protein